LRKILITLTPLVTIPEIFMVPIILPILVVSTFNSTLDYTLWTLYSYYYKGSANIELLEYVLLAVHQCGFILFYLFTSAVFFIIISLLMSPLLGHSPSLWITHKENGP
jgi:hypothetical protein